jgi:hypothetical protein
VRLWCDEEESVKMFSLQQGKALLVACSVFFVWFVLMTPKVIFFVPRPAAIFFVFF